MIDFQTLAARGLNISRAHRPTYIGLRLLLDQVRGQPYGMEAFLEQRTQGPKVWRYFSFPLLKEIGENKNFAYRQCLTGSPLTVLAEAYVLALMQDSDQFAPPPGVYSYLWPGQKRAGRNFEYFFEGYRRRNRAIVSFLKAHPDHVAVIGDIRKFYPSVDLLRLKQRTFARTARIQDKAKIRSINTFVEGLLTAGKPKHAGIPVGPDLSHLLGHIALETTDAEMYRAFGERYFRYVDDIIVLCQPSERAEVERRLASVVEAEGLALHEEKQDVVAGSVWIENDPVKEDEPRPFESFIESLMFYLLRHSRAGEVTALRRAFRDEGFSFPINRLAGLARSSRYRAFMEVSLIKRRGVGAWLRGIFDTPNSLVSQARELRREMERMWLGFQEKGGADSSMRRRWRVQNCRYVFNRMLYLWPSERYSDLVRGVPELHELAEGRIVALALAEKDATGVLKCPGRVADTFCQMWTEEHGASSPKISWPQVPGWAESAVAAHMAMYFPVQVSADFERAFSERLKGSGLLLRIAKGDGAGVGAARCGSYLDELDLLLRGVPREQVYQMIATRFDESESFALDALSLGGAGWSLG